MPFDPREATVTSVHLALLSGKATCRDVVEAFIARIETYNPKINAIISLNPNALREADRIDHKIATNQPLGALYGVPILLKDNFDAIDMPTTAASVAFQDLWPTEDAEVVSTLREADAIILGKTNMHEFALEGLTVSSLGGQTFNPYDFTRTPGGSSGGSGAAVAASFAVMATGTDTVNSLRSPASANSLYSFRPTPGLLSCKGVIPVSSSQDAVGMIGRSLNDLARALKTMVKLGPSQSNEDYVQALAIQYSNQLSSCRIGVLRGYMDTASSPETDPVNLAMEKVESSLRAAGATVIDLDEDAIPTAPTILTTMDRQTYEIRDQMDKYLSSSKLKGTYPQCFADIFKSSASSRYNLRSSSSNPEPHPLVIPQLRSYIDSALLTTHNTSHPSYGNCAVLIVKLIGDLYDLFETHNLTCLIYPQQRNLTVPIGSPSQSGRNGILAAVTGSPVICMPIGFSPPSDTAPIGVPIGMEIMGLRSSESKLFEVAKGLDDILAARRAPVTDGLGDHVEVKRRYEEVPHIKPGGLDTVDLKAYPLDTFDYLSNK